MLTLIVLQIKAGDVHILANTSFLLVKRDWSSEIRLHAFKMLQVHSHSDLLLVYFIKIKNERNLADFNFFPSFYRGVFYFSQGDIFASVSVF